MDPTLILIAVALAVFVFFQFRSSRKRNKETAARQAAIAPGVEIMTNFGLYGTVLSIDEDTNMALVETTPGTVIRIHRQTILKAVEDEVPEVSATEDDESPSSIRTALSRLGIPNSVSGSSRPPASRRARPHRRPRPRKLTTDH
jgi:preprotein translocase subunit YajC